MSLSPRDPSFSAERFCSFAITRPTVEKPAVGICASEPFGVELHYFRGRSTPCTDEHDCPACVAGNPARFVCHMWVICENTGTVILLALPYSASLAIYGWRRANGKIMGKRIFATRSGKTNRSRVSVKIGREPAIEAESLPELPNIGEVLERIWRIR